MSAPRKKSKRGGGKPNKKSPAEPSAGVQIIASELSAQGLAFAREVRFDGCRDTACLPFDFEVVVDGRAALIEFDGEQHFAPSSLYHRSPTAFSKEQAHDRTKTAYAASHSLFLLRAAYDLSPGELREQLRIFLASVRKGARPRVVFASRDPRLYDYLREESSSGCSIA